jgi:hypothetical protein
VTARQVTNGSGCLACGHGIEAIAASTGDRNALALPY